LLQIEQIWQDGGFQQPTDKIDPVDVFRTSWFGRQKWNDWAHTRLVVDRFVDTASACCFARFMEGVSPHLSLEGTYRVETCRAGGWALFPMAGQEFAYWIPSAPKARKVDTFGRILDEIDCPIGSIEMRPNGLTVVLGPVPGYCIDCLAWRFPADDKNIRSTLLDLPAIETQAIFLWGSHTTYQRLTDVYDHLIHGHVYENRFAWPHRRKICSENDAHALRRASGLERTTGKRLYTLLKRQLLLSVLARQDKDGGWRHGEWTDGMNRITACTAAPCTC
jgi:hypothetical protein